MNDTSLYINLNQLRFAIPDNVKIIYVSLISTTFGLYLPSAIIILCVFFTTSHIRENVRYLLFSHMLISDSLQLTLAFILFLLAMYIVFVPVTLCCIIAGISTTTALITPYNLALMSLERYIAVCFPLRHGVICTVGRCNMAITIMWGIAVFPIIIELTIFSYFVDRNFFSMRMICIWRHLQRYNFQITLRFLSFSLSFSIVVLTILFTYIKVMLVARKIGTKTSSASKAAKTVLLHGFQLLLNVCLFSSTFTETLFRDYYILAPINFFVFICLPLYISPFVYGIRDETIRKCLSKLIYST
ncbi:odorant receptor 131-2-like [Leptodactylus fuscus]|uniref:odorant receptor 131-2-like n=1 Tax=Leptodactylus fuscus TaxID=238119 RepID=UPI003F4F2385